MTGSRGLSATQDNLQKNVDHLATVSKQEVSLPTIPCGVLVLCTRDTDVSSPEEDQECESREPVVIPYVVEMSEDNKCVCRK